MQQVGTVNLNGNPMTITFNIRHGIMWAGNTTIGMAPRELTADDVVYTFKRAFASPTVAGSLYLGFFGDGYR